MFENKTILIIGASVGLGNALAKSLANKTSNLALMSRNYAALKETASQCGTNPLLIKGDITQEEDCKKAIASVINQYGHLDYLILNAGISMWSSFEDLSDLTTMKALIDTNYIGALNCTYHALPYLKQTKGMIAVISSIQGKIGVPYHTGYAASKHALEGFFNSLRIEQEKKIDILMISPGWIAGTELKKRALGKGNNVSTNKYPHTKHALTLDVCCREIINAMVKRKRELILPKKYQWLPLLKLLAPTFLNKLIFKAVLAKSTCL